jgi:hypothetical protein
MRTKMRTDIILTMEPRGPRVTIEFETTTEAIAGRLLDDHGASVPFNGWLGLASALERTLAFAREAEPASADSHEEPN